MKDVYRTWPKSFVSGLEFIRTRDSVLLEHPVYVRRTTELFHTLSAEVATLATTADLNFSEITSDSLYDYYLEGRAGDPAMSFLIVTAKQLCDALRVSEIFYDIEALSFCLLVVQGRYEYAMRCLHRLIRPAVMLYRIQDSAHFTGMRGGKPTHKLYGEAMVLCGDYMHEHPDARGSDVARKVRSKLQVNYKRVPAERTIRDWLRKF
jgi:hypothetical protein